MIGQRARLGVLPSRKFAMIEKFRGSKGLGALARASRLGSILSSRLGVNASLYI
jgi:hypothetical protein